MKVQKGIVMQIDTPDLLWMVRHDELGFFGCTYAPDEEDEGEPALVAWPSIPKRRREKWAECGWRASRAPLDTVMCRARALGYKRVIVFAKHLVEFEVF